MNTKHTAAALRAARRIQKESGTTPIMINHYAAIIDEETGLPALIKALANMVREWEEIIGSESENSTPADTLERAKAALAAAQKEPKP